MKKYNIVGKNTTRIERIVFYIVFITLVLSLAFAVYSLITAPYIRDNDSPKIKSDYLLMVIQCIAAIVVILLPSFIEHKLKLEIPSLMNILLIVFLYTAVYLGELKSFYFKFKNWDTLLHGFSGMMLAATSFSVINLLNNNKEFNLNPLFVALFAFCFAIACGVIWEIYEFGWDYFAGLNMQKYALEDGTLLMGRGALYDTMVDLIVDTIGALIVSIIGFISIKYKKGWLENLLIHRNSHDFTDPVSISNEELGIVAENINEIDENAFSQIIDEDASDFKNIIITDFEQAQGNIDKKDIIMSDALDSIIESE